MSISKTVNKLQEVGFSLSLEGDKVKVTFPGQPPREAKPLLNELKARKKEAVDYLKNQVNDGLLLSLFSQAVDELDKDYPKGCLLWLEKNAPDLDNAINEAEERLRQTWYECRECKATLGDFKEALEGYCKPVKEGIRAYEQVYNDT